MKDAEWPGRGGGGAFLPLLCLSASVHLIPGAWRKAGSCDCLPPCVPLSFQRTPIPSAPTGTTTDPFSQLSSAALTAVSQLSGLLCDGQKHRSTSATLACPGVNSMLNSPKCHRSFKLNWVCAPSKRKAHGDSCLS